MGILPAEGLRSGAICHLDTGDSGISPQSNANTMTKITPLATPPEFQRYDCHLCGSCCRAGFAVVVTEEEHRRIEGQGWKKNSEFQGKRIFVRQPGGNTVLNQNPDGACIFLDEQNRCRIHAKFGEAAKPFACRPYPFVFLATGAQVRVSLRFDCPSAAGNCGRPLSEHRGDMSRLAARAVPEAASGMKPPVFRTGLSLDWRELTRIAGAFDRILAAESLDITRRVLACADLAGILEQARMDDLQGRKLEEFLGVLVRGLTHGVEVNPLQRKRPLGMLPPLFRQAAGLYGRLDRISDVAQSPFGKAGLLSLRLTHSLRLLSGAGRVPPVRADLPRARFADLEQSFGIPDAEAASALTRYYRIKFGALGFCGRAFYGYGFLEGAGAMLLTYPLILWYARLFALGEGKTILNAATIQRAVRVVDRPHGNSIALAIRTERIRLRFLSEHENLTTLIAWYGT